jgi:hypothetical protein
MDSSSYDNPPTKYLFPITEIDSFDRDTKHSTWFFRSCTQQNLHEFWKIGVPADSAAFSTQDLFIDNECDSEYDMTQHVVYIHLDYSLSANEIKRMYTNAKHPDYCLDKPGQSIKVPAMRPSTTEFKSEPEYVSRSQNWCSQWVHQYHTEFVEFDMPKQVPMAAVVTMVAVVIDNMQVAIVASAPKRSCPNDDSLGSAANSIVASAPKRSCPNDDSLGSAANSILSMLHVAMNTDSIAAGLGFTRKEAKKHLNKILYQLQAAGKIRVVGGWGSDKFATGKPIWQKS